MNLQQALDASRTLAKQRDITQKLFDSYNISNPQVVKAALSDAAWRGFCAGLEAGKQLHGKKE